MLRLSSAFRHTIASSSSSLSSSFSFGPGCGGSRIRGRLLQYSPLIFSSIIDRHNSHNSHQAHNLNQFPSQRRTAATQYLRFNSTSSSSASSSSSKQNDHDDHHINDDDDDDSLNNSKNQHPHRRRASRSMPPNVLRKIAIKAEQKQRIKGYEAMYYGWKKKMERYRLKYPRPGELYATKINTTGTSSYDYRKNFKLPPNRDKPRKETPKEKVRRLKPFMDQPVPEDIVPQVAKERIKYYIQNEFLKLFPDGARLRKLQREIAFRMEKKGTYLGDKTKLPVETILTILGEMEKDQQVHVRFGPTGKIIVGLPLTATTTSTSNNKRKKAKQKSPPRPMVGEDYKLLVMNDSTTGSDMEESRIHGDIPITTSTSSCSDEGSLVNGVSSMMVEEQNTGDNVSAEEAKV